MQYTIPLFLVLAIFGSNGQPSVTTTGFCYVEDGFGHVLRVESNGTWAYWRKSGSIYTCTASGVGQVRKSSGITEVTDSTAPYTLLLVADRPRMRAVAAIGTPTGSYHLVDQNYQNSICPAGLPTCEVE
jgi:hypothetical protein